MHHRTSIWVIADPKLSSSIDYECSEWRRGVGHFYGTYMFPSLLCIINNGVSSVRRPAWWKHHRSMLLFVGQRGVLSLTWNKLNRHCRWVLISSYRSAVIFVTFVNDKINSLLTMAYLSDFSSLQNSRGSLNWMDKCKMVSTRNGNGNDIALERK